MGPGDKSEKNTSNSQLSSNLRKKTTYKELNLQTQASEDKGDVAKSSSDGAPASRRAPPVRYRQSKSKGQKVGCFSPSLLAINSH